MKSFAISLLVLAALAGPAAAKGAPPTADQQARFLKQCLTVAPEAQTLCTCKSQAIMKLVDTDFIEVIIASMKGKALESKYYLPYNDYIARSNQVCKPDY